jgi:hypothetical protein
MPDNRSLRGKPDQIRINVHEDYELRRWCAHFGVTADQLRAAVHAVGPMVKDVQRYLGK